MARPKISVIIPALNEQGYIEDCLKSLKSQSRKPDEIIVVDNGSTDNTVKIARRYKARILKEPRQGTAYARNLGFDKAKGEILVRLDADSVAKKDFLKTLEQDFKDIDGWSCYTYAYSGTTNIANTYRVHYRRLVMWLVNFFSFRFNKWISGHEMLFGSSMAISKKAWRDIRSSVINEGVWEDLDISVSMDLYGYKLKVNRNTLVGISARGSLGGSPMIVRRLKEWVNTYWPANKFAAFVLVVFLIPIFILAYVFSSNISSDRA